MRRQSTTLRRFLAVVALCALVGLLWALWGARTVGAAPTWRHGPRDEGRVVLWAEGLAVAPVVQIVGGWGQLNPPEDDGAGTLRAVVWCEGCQQIFVDGVRVWPVWRVALPLMMRTP